jgi:CBS domain-containing protein
MAAYGIAHLAVTEPGSRHPIGVVSTLDIARAVATRHGGGEVPDSRDPRTEVQT